MENFFVPYEQALALKELGFNQKCLGQFNIHQGNKWLFSIDLSGEGQYPLTTLACIAPLYRQAFKFFRDKYKMDSVILRTFCMTNSYHYRIVINNNEDNVIDAFVKSNRTYEEAELECLNKLIEIVKTKKNMQNIHLIPTERKSRLFIDVISDELTLTKHHVKIKYMRNRHLYITEGDDINPDDWFIYKTDYNHFIKKCIERPAKQNVIGADYYDYFLGSCSKIILTTDLKLIKKGVQPIGDEFLEWFINHSNCKQIEIKKGFEDETEYGYNFLDYKIIIPK